MCIKKFSIVIILVSIFLMLFLSRGEKDSLPIVAIANYGPHASLEAAIIGLKEELSRAGFVENKNIQYKISDVGFNASLIPQMIANLKSNHPKVMVVMTTPVAQFAKGTIKDIPLVYSAITDPVEAGLIKNSTQSDGNMTGSSDKQNLDLLLQFAKILMPRAKTVGLLYGTAEPNAIALVKMMKKAAENTGMQVMSIPIDQSRDIPIRIQGFKGRVDFIYVGASGPIQPALPTIVAESTLMNIPVLNVDEDAVKTNMALASFGVDYYRVGANAGKLVVSILKGVDIKDLDPVYPQELDHHGFISQKRAKEFDVEVVGL